MFSMASASQLSQLQSHDWPTPKEKVGGEISPSSGRRPLRKQNHVKVGLKPILSLTR